jgi:hypothetical protein
MYRQGGQWYNAVTASMGEKGVVMAKRSGTAREHRKRVSKSPPISGKGAVARLHEAIEVEREILSKAESVLGCLAIAMEYETNGPGKPYYPDVARIARDMVRGSINALDPLALKRLRDKVEEEVHRTYIPSTLCPLTLDYCVSL